jgi:hypothetical protein
MANFTVRVELHQATWDDYETLHAAMAQRGFSRSIIGGDGKTYQLPLAEYNGSSENLDTSEIRDIAQTAAKTTGKKNAVLVTQGVRAWVGLEVIN